MTDPTIVDVMNHLAAWAGATLSHRHLTEEAANGSSRADLFICEGDCSCLFWPDGSGPVYPDRYSHLGVEGDLCDTNCPCHDFPYEIEDITELDARFPLP